MLPLALWMGWKNTTAPPAASNWCMVSSGMSLNVSVFWVDGQIWPSMKSMQVASF